MTTLVELTWALVFVAAALAAFLLGGLMVWGLRGLLARQAALAALAALALTGGLLGWISYSALATQSGAQHWTLVQAGWAGCHATTLGKKPLQLDHCQVVGVFRNDGGSATGLEVFVATFKDRGGASCTAPLSDFTQHSQSVTVSCTVAAALSSGTAAGNGVDTSAPPLVVIQAQSLAQELGSPSASP